MGSRVAREAGAGSQLDDGLTLEGEMAGGPREAIQWERTSVESRSQELVKGRPVSES